VNRGTTNVWTRRRVLEGLGIGAVTMALPPLEAFGRTPARKLVLFHFGNGAPQDLWKPLTLQREGLGDVVDRCTLMRGLSLNELVKPLAREGVNGHAAGMMTVLTASPAVPDPTDRQIGWHYKATGESCDHVVARFINGGRPVRFWGGNTRPEMPKESYLSYASGGIGRLPLTRTRDMIGAFAGVNGRSGGADAAVRLREQRLMNGMKAQADALKKRLGVADRQRVEQYLSAIAEVEASSQPPPTSGGASTRMCRKPSIEAPTTQFTYGPNHVKNLFELAFRALQCDLTRVMVVSLTVPGGGPLLRDMGIASDQSDHTPSHHGTDPEKIDLYRQSTLFKVRSFAEFVRKLASERGPDGKTVLDQSAVICFSEMGEGDGHSGDNVAAIVAGGAFKRPRSGMLEVDAPMANLWLTAMRAVGISAADLPTFGNSTGTIDQLV